MPCTAQIYRLLLWLERLPQVSSVAITIRNNWRLGCIILTAIRNGASVKPVASCNLHCCWVSPGWWEEMRVFTRTLLREMGRVRWCIEIDPKPIQNWKERLGTNSRRGETPRARSIDCWSLPNRSRDVWLDRWNRALLRELYALPGREILYRNSQYRHTSRTDLEASQGVWFFTT